MRRGSAHGWIAVTTFLGCSVAANMAGCGGGVTTNGNQAEDSGSDAPEDGASGADGASSGASSGSSGSSGSSSGDGGDATASSSSGGDSGDETGTDSSSSSSGGDSGDDGTTSSSSGGEGGSTSSSGGSSSGGDAGADAPDGAAPCVSGSACTTAGGLNGICDVSGSCATCSTGGAGVDTPCTNAYGGGSAANPYVCVAGSCQPGNCTGDTGCTSAGTPTCGFSTPNVCGGCTSDSQCPSGDVCVTVTPDAGSSVMGQCVTATAAGCAFSALGTPSACPYNPADECCPGLGACYPGDCCITASVGSMCAGAGVSCKAESPGELNGGGICSACAAVTGTNPTYFVDPVRGNDATGTGNTSSGTAPGCAFKTITRALQVLGASPPTGTSIKVIGGVNDAGTTTISTGETYPITLNANTTLTTSGGPIVIDVPAKTGANQTLGIVLGGNLAGITSGTGAALTIDGQSQTATTGVVVRSPSATISGITVQDFATEGVLVANSGSAASALTIGPGTHLNANKVDGLLVQGTSSATVSATSAAAAPILFDNNNAHGIRVTGQGILTMTGALGSAPPGTGTIVAQGNGTAGIWVQTTSTTQSSVNAVVSTGSTTGNGIRIVPGSNVKVRGSWLLGNSQGSGIDVENAGGTVASVSNIDLGSGASPGNNVLQAASGNNPNGAAGICLRLPAGSSATLAAEGNVFRGVNCAAGAGTLVTVAGRGCGGGPDVGGSLVAPDAGAGDKIDVTTCSYP